MRDQCPLCVRCRPLSFCVSVRYICQKTLIPSTPNQVLRLKEELLQGDFADNLQLLQVRGGRGAVEGLAAIPCCNWQGY